MDRGIKERNDGWMMGSSKIGILNGALKIETIGCRLKEYCIGSWECSSRGV